MEIVKSDKELYELARVILEQNRIILLTNKMLLERIVAPAIVIEERKAK